MGRARRSAAVRVLAVRARELHANAAHARSPLAGSSSVRRSASRFRGEPSASQCFLGGRASPRELGAPSAGRAGTRRTRTPPQPGRWNRSAPRRFSLLYCGAEIRPTYPMTWAGGAVRALRSQPRRAGPRELGAVLGEVEDRPGAAVLHDRRRGSFPCCFIRCTIFCTERRHRLGARSSRSSPATSSAGRRRHSSTRVPATLLHSTGRCGRGRAARASIQRPHVVVRLRQYSSPASSSARGGGRALRTPPAKPAPPRGTRAAA